MLESFNKKNLQFSDFEILKRISEGEHGLIFQVRHKVSNVIYALKAIQKNQNIEDQEEKVKREISIMKNMSNISHPNIMKFYNDFEDGYYFCLVLEFIEGETLDEKLKKHKDMGKYLKQNLIIIILKGIINGLKYLHERKVMHRDISPDNIMIDNNNNIKIIDFGISRYYKMNNSQNIINNSINSSNLTVLGKNIYASPEINQAEINNQEKTKYDFKTDVFSLGVTMFYLMTYEFPYIDDGEKMIKADTFINPNKYNQQLINIVMSMLEENQNDRPSIQDIYNDLGNLIGYNNMDIYHIIKMNDINLENNYIIKRSAFFSIIYCLYNIPEIKSYFGGCIKMIKEEPKESTIVIRNFIEIINDFKNKNNRVHSITKFIENISKKILIFKEYNKLTPQSIIEILFEYFFHTINKLFVYNNTSAFKILDMIHNKNFQIDSPIILKKIEEFKDNYTNIFADIFYFLILERVKCPKCDNIIEEKIDFEYEIEINEPTSYIDQLFNQINKITNLGKKSKICNKCFEIPLNLIITKTLINGPKILIIHSENNLDIEENIEIKEYISPNKQIKYQLISVIVKEYINNSDIKYCVSSKKKSSGLWIYFPDEEGNPEALSFIDLLKKGSICTAFYQLNEQ